MGFGDVFAGWEQAAQEHHKTLLQMDYQDKRELAQNYAKMAEDPRYDQSSRNVFKQRSLHILTLEPGKKLPKEYQDYTLKVQPPAEVGKQEQPGAMPMGSVGAPLGMKGPDIEPPMPPPHPLFEEQPWAQQLKQTGEMASAKAQGQMDITKWKAAEWSKAGRDVVQGEDGRRYAIYRQTRVNPENGQQETKYERNPLPLGFFAPRKGDPITAADMAKAVDMDIMEAPLDQAGNPIDIKAVLAKDPNFIFESIGENRYIPVTEKKGVSRPIGNVLFNQGAITGPKLDQPLGVANTGSVVKSPVRTGEVSAETGENVFGTATRVTTPATPGATVPGAALPGAAPPPTPPAVAPQQQQQAAPVQDLSRPSVITDAVVAQMLRENPWMKNDPEIAIGALKASHWTMPGEAAPASMAAPAPAAPPAAPPQQPGAGPSGSLIQRPPGTNINATILNREKQVMMAVDPAVGMLVGSKDNPFFESLEDFGHMMDDRGSRDRIGAAFRIIQKGMAENAGAIDAAISASIGPVKGSVGTLGALAGNWLGLPNILAKSQSGVIEAALKDLKPEEQRMLNRMFAAYGTIVGFRKITSGGAYKFSVDQMEREIPIPGVTGINSSKSYFNKLSQLMEEPFTAMSNMYSVPEDKRAFYKSSAIRLAIKSRSERMAIGPKGEKLHLINGQLYDELGNSPNATK